MNRSALEASLGWVVIALATYGLATAYHYQKRVSHRGTYALMAKFNRVDGLKIGSDVRLSGVPVGVVTQIAVNKETYSADVTFTVDSSIPLPVDTAATIQADGLLGPLCLDLLPGGDENYLKAGGVVSYTRDPLSIPSLINEFLFGNKNVSGDQK